MNDDKLLKQLKENWNMMEAPDKGNFFIAAEKDHPDRMNYLAKDGRFYPGFSFEMGKKSTFVIKSLNKAQEVLKTVLTKYPTATIVYFDDQDKPQFV